MCIRDSLNTLNPRSNNISKSKNGMSESSIYYEPSRNNVIEEYSNKLEPILDNQDKNESSEKQNIPKNTGNKLKYFSHLNV